MSDNGTTLSTPSVITAYPDYAPGSIAEILASGLIPAATLQFMVQIIDPLTGELLQPVTWTVTVGADGTAATDFSVTNLYAGQRMVLTAREGSVDSTGAFVASDPLRRRRSRTLFLSRRLRELSSTSPR